MRKLASVWVGLGLLALAPAATRTAVAQSSPNAASQVNMKELAEVCSGISSIATTGEGSGTYKTGSGFDVQFRAGQGVTVTQSGNSVLTMKDFTYQGYQKCLVDLTLALTPRPAPPEPQPCRDPSHGVERFNTDLNITRESGWRGGGYDPDRWCNDVVTALHAEHPAVGSTFDVVGKAETEESKCKPANCPQYNYTCTVHLRTDPLYVLKLSPACH